jgi:hypothetical protein
MKNVFKLHTIGKGHELPKSFMSIVFFNIEY